MILERLLCFLRLLCVSDPQWYRTQIPITVENRKINRLSHRFLIGRPIQIAKYDAKLTKKSRKSSKSRLLSHIPVSLVKICDFDTILRFFAKNKKS